MNNTPFTKEEIKKYDTGFRIVGGTLVTIGLIGCLGWWGVLICAGIGLIMLANAEMPDSRRASYTPPMNGA